MRCFPILAHVFLLTSDHASTIIILSAILYKLAFAQTIRIDNLPTQGILLNQGWNYHPCNNAAWASSSWDDKAGNRLISPNQSTLGVDPFAYAENKLVMLTSTNRG